jgi:hypothetical protein
MLSNEQFFGGGLTLTKNTLYRREQRALDVSGRAFIQLPSRTKLIPGGPYFYFINHGGSGVPLKRETGAAMFTMANNTVTTALLGRTKWVAFSRALSTAKPYGSFSTRTQPIGYEATISPFVEPTDYTEIDCGGVFRHARFCETGGFADVWMTADNAAPHFTDGVAVFKYNGFCYYFASSDAPKSLAGSNVIEPAWVDWFFTCDDCTGGGCQPDDPLMPQSIVVEITDPSHTPDDTFSYIGGTRVFTKLPGAASYEHAPVASNCWFFGAIVECTSDGWDFAVMSSGTGCPGGTSGLYASQRHKSMQKTKHGPYIGSYPFTSFSTGVDMGDPLLPFWPGLTVRVIGYGT